jgi:hypothetical protein
LSTALQMSFFRVPLVCEAAPSIGCGTIARPVLADLERQFGVREACLNREGTVLAVVWDEGAPDVKAVLSTLHRHGIAGIELQGAEYGRNCEAFAAGEWYRPTQMQDLSAEEARLIAARLVRRLEQKVSLSAGTSERLAETLERACSKALAEASPTSESARRQQIASALRDATRGILDPAAFGAFTAVVSLGHRPLPGER